MARSFGTLGDRIALSDSFSLLDQTLFSLIIWFREDGTGYRHIYTESQAFNEEIFLRLEGGASDGVLTWFYRTPTAIVNVSSAGTYDDGNWHWVFVVRRASADFEVYVDGTSVITSTTDPATTTVGSPSPTIGNWHATGPADEPFGDGLAHFVLFRGTALTVAEAKDAAFGNFGRKTPTTFMPIWGNSTTEPDLSPNANNGTVTGTAKIDHPGQVKWRRRSVRPISKSDFVASPYYMNYYKRIVLGTAA